MIISAKEARTISIETLDDLIRKEAAKGGTKIWTTVAVSDQTCAELNKLGYQTSTLTYANSTRISW